MLEYMITPFYRYAEFKGRSRRLEFWAFALFNSIVTAVLASLAFSTGFSYHALIQSARFTGSLGSATMALFAILGLYGLGIVIPTLAVNVRRLHDRGMSGWWLPGFVLIGLLPFVGWIGSIVYLVLMFLPGTAGVNRYGENPKNPASSEIFA